MRGSFFGMNVSLSGLFAAQRNLDTIAHNNANVNTAGYSRQKVAQSAASPIRLFNKTGMVGTGVDVISVARVRDLYLDQKLRFQTTIQGEWTQKSALVEQVETQVSGGVDGQGFNSVINDFYAVAEELSKDPSSMSLRAVVKEEAKTYTTYFNNLARSLEKMQEDTNFDVKGKVELINSLGHRIEALNEQIYQAEILGETANDLRDARDLLVDELSGYVNIDYGEHNYGKLSSGADDRRFYIYIGGTQFLQHYSDQKSVVNELICVSRDEKLNDEDIVGLYDVAWTKPAGRNNPVEITGGELRGLLDVRDGNSGLVQTDRFNMLTTPPTKLNVSVGVNVGGTQDTVTLSLTFSEYVPNVESMSAAEIAAYMAEKINAAISEQAGVEINPENRATVEITAAGLMRIDLSGITTSGGQTPETVSATIDGFTLSAPALLKSALGFEEVAPVTAGSGAVSLTSTRDIAHPVETVDYKGIPYYTRKLNEYVRTYAMAFNEGFIDSNTDMKIDPDEVSTGHAAGYNIKQQAGEPPSGVRFFTILDNSGNEIGTGDFMMMSELRTPSLYGLDPDSQEYEDNIVAILNAYNKVTAKNFSVSADIMNDVGLISNSASAENIEDNSVLLDLIGQRNNQHMFSEGAAEDYIQSLTTDAAVDASQATFMVETQEKFVAMLTERKKSISGVWEDEEFADMIRHQQMYNASAMMFNTFNGIYDTLINRLGL